MNETIDIKSAAIVGAGALGLMYMEAIEKTLGREAYFLAEGSRYEKLKDARYDINGSNVSYPVRSPEELSGSPDFLLLCVKNHHLKEICPLLKKVCGPDTIVLSVLNGIESEQYLEKNLPRSTVLYSVVLGMDSVKVGNSLFYSTKGKFVIGTKNNGRTEELASAKSLLERSGFPCELPADIHRELWYKWMINIGINQASALMGADYGVFQKCGPARDLMNDAMLETIRVAEAMGIDLHKGDLDRWYDVLETLGPEGKTSMLQDMEAMRKTEVECFAGKLIDLAGRKGIDVPVNKTLFRLITTKEALYLK